MTNIINLDPTTWSKQDWRDAYESHCATAKQPLGKKEYYATVMANAERLKPVLQPLSDELRDKWTNGWRNAVVWAKKRKCNQWGQSLENSRPQVDIDALANDVKDIQWQLVIKEQ